MLVVFDWDGTIIDSAAKIVHSMQRAADDCQLEVLSASSIENIIGLALPEVMRVLYPGESSVKHMQMQKAYSQAFVAADEQPCDFFDGVEECLLLLQQRGHHIAVATGKSRRGLDRVLTRLDWLDKFDASRCADETASKPDPLMLFELMQQLQVPAEETLMVGDTEYDLEMALNAKVSSVGVSYGAHSVDRLQKHKPIAIIDSILALSELVS